MAKNYAVGKYVALWFNQGKDGKAGYYTVSIRRVFKDKNGADVEQKISMFADDAIRLAAELQKATNMLLTPREIVQVEEPKLDAINPDDIPTDMPF